MISNIYTKYISSTMLLYCMKTVLKYTANTTYTVTAYLFCLS